MYFHLKDFSIFQRVCELTAYWYTTGINNFTGSAHEVNFATSYIPDNVVTCST